MYHCVSPCRRMPPVVDHACANYPSWYSMLPLLLPPVTSSPPLTNYFRLMAGSPPPCQAKSDELQMSNDAKVQGRGKGQGHDWSLLLPPVTSSPPPTNYFRLPTESPTCPTKTSTMLRSAEGQSQLRGQGHGSCWRPVCLDEGQSANKEFGVHFRYSPTEKTVSHGGRSMAVPRPSTAANVQTTVDLERNEATMTARYQPLVSTTSSHLNEIPLSPLGYDIPPLFPKPSLRTKKYCSSINYGDHHYQ